MAAGEKKIGDIYVELHAKMDALKAELAQAEATAKQSGANIGAAVNAGISSAGSGGVGVIEEPIEKATEKTKTWGQEVHGINRLFNTTIGTVLRLGSHLTVIGGLLVTGYELVKGWSEGSKKNADEWARANKELSDFLDNLRKGARDAQNANLKRPSEEAFSADKVELLTASNKKLSEALVKVRESAKYKEIGDQLEELSQKTEEARKRNNAFGVQLGDDRIQGFLDKQEEKRAYLVRQRIQLEKSASDEVVKEYKGKFEKVESDLADFRAQKYKQEQDDKKKAADAEQKDSNDAESERGDRAIRMNKKLQDAEDEAEKERQDKQQASALQTIEANKKAYADIFRQQEQLTNALISATSSLGQDRTLGVLSNIAQDISAIARAGAFADTQLSSL